MSWIHVVPMIVFSFRKKYVIFQNLQVKKIDLQIYYDRLESVINLVNYKTWIAVSIHASSLCPSQSNLRYIEAYESTVNWVCLVNSLAPKLDPYNLFFFNEHIPYNLKRHIEVYFLPLANWAASHSSSLSLSLSLCPNTISKDIYKWTATNVLCSNTCLTDESYA